MFSCGVSGSDDDFGFLDMDSLGNGDVHSVPGLLDDDDLNDVDLADDDDENECRCVCQSTWPSQLVLNTHIHLLYTGDPLVHLSS